MAQAIHSLTTSKFHNLFSEALADALGHADACLKGTEADSVISINSINAVKPLAAVA
jgi:hypothetical protein